MGLIVRIDRLFIRARREKSMQQRDACAFAARTVVANVWLIYCGNFVCPWETRGPTPGSGCLGLVPDLGLPGPLGRIKRREPRSTYSVLEKYQLNLVGKIPLFLLWKELSAWLRYALISHWMRPVKLCPWQLGQTTRAKCTSGKKEKGEKKKRGKAKMRPRFARKVRGLRRGIIFESER